MILEPRYTTAQSYFSFARILYLICSYVARGRIFFFFCTSASFCWYSRLLTIFSGEVTAIPRTMVQSNGTETTNPMKATRR